jgi:hypothetical protein
LHQSNLAINSMQSYASTPIIESSVSAPVNCVGRCRCYLVGILQYRDCPLIPKFL